MEDKIVKLLSDLAAFNLLNRRVVHIIGDVFNVDAVELCSKNGIVYFNL